MAKRKRRTDNSDPRIEVPAHIPKRVHFHIAREVLDKSGWEEAEGMVRHLLPHMRDRALGLKAGTSTFKSWTPTRIF